MSDVFRFSLADAAKPFVFSPHTLGIEVTQARLAAACGLGNIDPQHGEGARCGAPAAVEVALTWPVPAAGAQLTTLRADLDALAAMAVLALRADGWEADDASHARIRRVATADRFDRGVWPGQRPLPVCVDDLLHDEPDTEVAIMAACATDPKLALPDRVKMIADWLRIGVVSTEHASTLRSRANRLAMSVTTGRTRVQPEAEGRIASVVSTEPGALRLGYRLAPVVVALNPEFGFSGGTAGRKYTIARWSAADLDLTTALAELLAIEPGWGGQAGIIGSPQGHPSRLPPEKVVATVSAMLYNCRAPTGGG